MSFKNHAIVSITENDYRIQIWYMRKNDAITLITNSNLKDEMEFCEFFLTIYKI